MRSKSLLFGVVLIIALSFLLILVRTGTTLGTGFCAQGSHIPVSVAEQPFSLCVSDTPALRMRGLSGVSTLLPWEGMLFVFDTDDYHGIWMKDMQIALDIAWVSADLEVVTVARDLLPDSYPDIFTPEEPARYVIEVPSGSLADLEPGMSVFFPKGVLPEEASVDN